MNVDLGEAVRTAKLLGRLRSQLSSMVIRLGDQICDFYP